MSNMFDNYAKQRNHDIPDNSHEFMRMKRDYADVIVLGADNTHNFILPHPKSEIDSFRIIYKQGIETKLTISWKDGMVGSRIIWDDVAEEYSCSFGYDVTAEETEAFNSYNRDVRVQLHVALKDGSHDMSEIYKIKIVPALTETEEQQ